MSCGRKIDGDFSPRKDTWNKSSNLLPSNWDPYPELKGDSSCYENFSCTGCNYQDKTSAYDNARLSPSMKVEHYGNNGCAVYANHGGQCGERNIGHMHQQKARAVRENYGNMGNPKGYENLGNTWMLQKPYTLG